MRAQLPAVISSSGAGKRGDRPEVLPHWDAGRSLDPADRLTALPSPNSPPTA